MTPSASPSSGDRLATLAPASPATRDLSPADGERIFALVEAAFDTAATPGSDGAAEFACVLARRSVRLRILGQRLADSMIPAFGHLPRPAPGTDPDLTVRLWDRSASSRPGVRRAADDVLPAGDCTAASTDGRWVIYRRDATVTCLDRREGRIVGWAEAGDRLPLLDRGRPLYAPLLLWLRDQRVDAVHAGLVATDGRGILVAGESGSGKSSTVLSCLLHGFDVVSDDHVALEARADGAWIGHGLHGSAHVHPEDLCRFPPLAGHAIRGCRPGEDKVLIPLSEACPGRLRPSAGIDLLVLPRVTGAIRPTISPASKSQALLRLAPSSLWMVRHARGAGLDSLAGLVERVPCYWLDLGGDAGAIAAGLRELVRKVYSR